MFASRRSLPSITNFTLVALATAAQAQESSEPDFLEPILVTASRIPEEAADSPYSSEVLTADDLQERAVRTLPQAFLNTPGVMVQQTTPGHGSPFIRGFTGRQNLLLQDGIRINNSTWRSGPVQYWNTLDAQAIDRVELIKSQGSVLYGSDAVGGTINTFSRSSGFREEDGFFSHGAASWRFDTNSESHIGRLEQRIGEGNKWGILLGISAKDVGDIRDSALGTMRGTGYSEESLDFKFEYAVSDTVTLTLVHNRIDQDDIGRWHNTIHNTGWTHGRHYTASGSDLERTYEQERSLTYLRFEETDSPVDWINSWSATLSYQHGEDSEYRVKGSGEQNLKELDVDTYGFLFQAESPLGNGTLVWGTDYYRDEVDSRGIQNGSDEPENRPVADDSSYDSLGIFASLNQDLGDRLEFTLGARYSYIKAKWDGYRPQGATEDQSGDGSWNNLSFSGRALYHLDDQWSLFGGLSQAFRAPNLDDLTGEQFALNGLDSSGSPDIDPEEYLTAELGLRFGNDTLSAQLSGYYTWIEDGIVHVTSGPNSEVSVNGSDGYVYGFEALAAWHFHPQWELSGAIAWQDGKQEQPESLGGPDIEDTIKRLHPLTGTLALKWTHPSERYWISGRINAADTQDNLSSRDGRDDQRIPINGTPSYFVTSLYAGWQASENLELNLALENLTDEDYRIHGSGQNMAGINATFGVKMSW